MTLQQQRAKLVLQGLVKLVEEDEDFADIFSQDLEAVLNVIQGCDGFGTEAQCDPRGDFREGEWSMGHVEGIDN